MYGVDGFFATSKLDANVSGNTEAYYSVVVPAATPYLDLTVIKQHLRLTNTTDPEEDSYLLLLDKAAAEMFEFQTGRTLKTTQYQVLFDQWYQVYRLYKSPFQSLDSFEYLKDGSFVPLDSAIYYHTVEEDWSRIIITDVRQLPHDKDDRLQAIKAVFTAGYTEISADIQKALLDHIGAMYAARGDCNQTDLAGLLPINSKNVYANYRIRQVVLDD